MFSKSYNIEKEQHDNMQYFLVVVGLIFQQQCNIFQKKLLTEKICISGDHRVLKASYVTTEEKKIHKKRPIVFVL